MLGVKRDEVKIEFIGSEELIILDSLIGKILYNLLDNSLRHGKKVTEIKLSYKNSKNKLMLVYEDNGIGIPEELKERIFEKNFSTGATAGLGLFLIREFCQLHGWKIKESGIYNQGVRFTIAIPKISYEQQENYTFLS